MPNIFEKLEYWWKARLTKKGKIILGILAVIIVIIFISAISGEETKPKEERKQTTPQESQQEAQPQTNKEDMTTVKYDLKETIENYRYDGGAIYFILIDKVDLSNDSFKKDIKWIVDNMTKNKGKKISLNIYDDLESLNLSYDIEENPGNYIGKTELVSKDAELSKEHLIATYDGEMETGPHYNTLMFFPATLKNDSKVGRYVETIEYNPK